MAGRDGRNYGSDSVREASSYLPGCCETILLSQATWEIKLHTFERSFQLGLLTLYTPSRRAWQYHETLT